MKKYMITIFTLLIVSFVKAQGHYDGQKAVAFNYLLTPKGQSYDLNYQQLFKQNYFGYRIDFLYVDREDNFKLIESEVVPHQIYSIGAAATYSLEKVIPHPFYIQLFVGAQYSYEELKLNKDYGIDYKKPNSNIYGVNFGAEVEYSITPHISLLLTSLNRISINSDINTFNPNYGLGLKYNF